MWEKKKILVIKHFAFSHNVFKCLLFQKCQRLSIFFVMYMIVHKFRLFHFFLIQNICLGFLPLSISLQWYFNSLDLDESTLPECDLQFYHLTAAWTNSKPLSYDNILDLSNFRAFTKKLIDWISGRWSNKQCGKRRKSWLSNNSPFPTMFSNAFYFKNVSNYPFFCNVHDCS